MRLAIVLPGLSNSGGIERVATLHANYFTSAGNDVEIVTFDDAGPPFFALHDDVAVTNIRTGRWPGPLSRIGQALALRAHLKRSRPSVVISIFRNILVILATRGMATPVIITEHMDPGRAWLGPGRRHLKKLLYGRADRLVSVSRGVDRQFSWLDPTLRMVIHNPVIAPVQMTAPRVLPVGRRHLLAAGRFVEAKGFDLLLEAFGQIATRNPTWDLCIVGGAPPPEYLRLVDEHSLDGRVRFPGVTRDISQYFREADLYVLSSRHEAFPMVLIEAMAHGLPAVAFACPSGPDEVVDHGRNGLLVPPEDVPALANALDQAMRDDAWRESAREQALQVADQFDLRTIMPRWEALLKEVTSAR